MFTFQFLEFIRFYAILRENPSTGALNTRRVGKKCDFRLKRRLTRKRYESMPVVAMER